MMRTRKNLLRGFTHPARPATAALVPMTMEEPAWRRAPTHCRRTPAGAWLMVAILSLCFPQGLHSQAPVSASQTSAGGAASRRPSPAPDAAGKAEYVIGADDVLDIYVINVPQLSRYYRVGSDGAIAIPLLASPVKAQGLTLNQLSAVIAQRLRAADMVDHANVLVSVKSSQAHAVAVAGAVRSPQVCPVFGPTTLLDVLSQAGGLAPDAGSTAIITRHNASPAASWPAGGTLRVDLQKLLATGDPSLNPIVYPGDKVTVQRAGVVYVVGAVQRPGGFPMSNGRDGMTVLQAVALGEGLKPTALRKKAMIIRRGQDAPNGREEIPVNLQRILSGHAADPGLAANDILFIPDSASKRALRRGAEAAVQIATGVVIWGHY
jgi:polysaccharide biosynthesis/export protein